MVENWTKCLLQREAAACADALSAMGGYFLNVVGGEEDLMAECHRWAKELNDVNCSRGVMNGVADFIEALIHWIDRSDHKDNLREMRVLLASKFYFFRFLEWG